jgi:hypothetical protein
MKSSPYGPCLDPGYKCATLVINNEFCNKYYLKLILKIIVSELWTATRLHEDGIISNRKIASYGETRT